MCRKSGPESTAKLTNMNSKRRILFNPRSRIEIYQQQPVDNDSCFEHQIVELLSDPAWRQRQAAVDELLAHGKEGAARRLPGKPEHVESSCCRKDE